MKTHLKILALLPLLLFAFTFSCSDDDEIPDTPEPELITDVYAVGYEQLVGSDPSTRKAVIWKNDVPTYFTF